MATDWKSALGALADSMPHDPETADITSSITDTEGTSAFDPRKLRIDFERKGRAGKCATIISGFGDLPDSRIAQIASELKRHLATGGSARGGEILIQGDRRDDIKKYFNIK